jgi:uncharacterized membrane protein
MTLPVEREQVPPGERALHKGAEVKATDGSVGRVTELQTDPETGQITHLVLRERRLWGPTDVVLPLSVIDRVEKDTIFLTLDKATIRALLAIPGRWRSRAEGLELVVLTSEQEGTAAEGLKTLKDLAKKDELAVLNTAVLVKHQDGKTSIREAEDVDAKHGALFGAITGGLIGLLGGPAGVVIGAAAGAATGGVAAAKIDMGFPDEYLKALQEGMQPGSSALVTLVEVEWVEQVADALSGLQGQVLRQEVSAELAAQLTAQEE